VKKSEEGHELGDPRPEEALRLLCFCLELRPFAIFLYGREEQLEEEAWNSVSVLCQSHIGSAQSQTGFGPVFFSWA
jgi:hypothetical protein